MPRETKIRDFVGKIVSYVQKYVLKASSMIYLFCFQFFAFSCAHYKFPLLLGYKHDYSRAYLVLFSTATTNACLLLNCSRTLPPSSILSDQFSFFMLALPFCLHSSSTSARLSLNSRNKNRHI